LSSINKSRVLNTLAVSLAANILVSADVSIIASLVGTVRNDESLARSGLGVTCSSLALSGGVAYGIDSRKANSSSANVSNSAKVVVSIASKSIELKGNAGSELTGGIMALIGGSAKDLLSNANSSGTLIVLSAGVVV